MSIKAVKWLMVNSGLACLLSISNLYAADSLYDIGFADGKATCQPCTCECPDCPKPPVCDVTINDPLVKAEGHAEGYAEGYNAGKIDGYNAGKTDGYNEGIADGYKTGCSGCSLQLYKSNGVFTATAPKLLVNGVETPTLSPVEFSLSSLIKDDKGFFALKADKFAGQEINNPNAVSVLSIVITGDKPLENILKDETKKALALADISPPCLSESTCRLDVDISRVPSFKFQTTEQVQWFGGVCQKDVIASIDGNQGNECTVLFNKDYQVLVISQVNSDSTSTNTNTSTNTSTSTNTNISTDTSTSTESTNNGSEG